MRRVPSLMLAAVFAAVTLAPALAIAGARAVDVTTVLPARSVASRTFAPADSAAPESTTFLRFMGVCPAPGCSTDRPICSTDSIIATVGGVLPNDCFSIRSIQLYYPPIMSIRPFAPWVVVVVDDGACLGRPCVDVPVDWVRSITMPPLPEGPYSLDVVVMRVSCSDSVPPPPSPQHSMPFAVVSCDSTPPPTACLTGDWRLRKLYQPCDGTVGPGSPAELYFTVHSSVPLDGLQGRFELIPSLLQVTNIEPVGAALGYRLAWSRTATGAKFVLFNDGGTPIPGDSLIGRAGPILHVTVAAPAGVTIPPLTRLYALDLLGSDLQGGAVPQCPMITLDVIGAPPFARICSAAADCDANGDATADVRDLVLMVHCLRGGAACPTTYDCNLDGAFTLDDILCCAWRILRTAPCTIPEGCIPDSAVSGGGEVRVSGGLPAEVAGEVHVPIHIDGADHVGAARLAMSIPADRWRIVSLDTRDAAWLTLAGVENGQAIMGAIRIGDGPNAAGLDLTLRLAPVGGAPAGGALGALSADLSTTDGRTLVAPVSGPVRALPGNPAIELSANRPDPFSGETRFTLSLPRASTVDLSVYDLSGRRITTLHRGALAAGVSEFGWNGHDDGGARLGAGVYFYRAVVDGRAVSRRMVYLGGN